MAVFAIEAVCGVLLGVAMLAGWAGGWRTEVLGVTLSVRAVWRPLLIAGLLVVARWFLIRDRTLRLAQFSNAGARIVAAALLVSALLGWTIHLSPHLGGADSYGYVSASERLREGSLIQIEPLAAILPYPDAINPATPMGYVASPGVPGTSVPAYPLGLPAAMALAGALFGPRAPFYVPLAMGLVLIAVSFWIVHRWTHDRFIALAAGAVVAFHPVVFAYAIQPMSDVPATALYLVAAACLMARLRSRETGLRATARQARLRSCGTGVRATARQVGLALVAGLAAGAAFLTRPALLPGAGALALLPLATGAQRARRVGAFGIALAVSVAAQGWLQWYLYGHPLSNGYGPAGELFSLAHLPTNARSYAYWAMLMHGPIWIGGFALGVWRLRDLSSRALLGATLVAALVPYAIYRPYDHWETLRFLLPLLVVATLFAVVGLIGSARRIAGDHAGTWLGLGLSIVLIASWVQWLDREQVFNLARSEGRFSQAGELVQRVTPANAVVLASLHSGSLRYYARRQTLDWSKIPEGRFDETVGALKARGLPVFLMLDGQMEQSQFEARHGGAIDSRGWLPAGQRRDVRLFEAP